MEKNKASKQLVPPEAKKPKKATSRVTRTSAKFFVCSDAQAYNNEKLLDRPVIMERGLRPRPNELALSTNEPIEMQIVARKWEKFTEQPRPVVLQLVREFYANGKFQLENDQVNVRGVMVSFSEETINIYFKLRAPEVDEFSNFLDSNIDYNAITEALCYPGTKWKLSRKQEGGVSSFQENTLNRFAKAWNKFICASVLPIGHTNDITKKLGVLLYAICLDMKINVGKVLQSSIIHTIEGKTTGGLTHPCLITALCRRAGITIDEKMEQTEPDSLINGDIIKSFKCHDFGTPRISGLGFEFKEGETIPPPPPVYKGRKRYKEDFATFTDFQARDKERRQAMDREYLQGFMHNEQSQFQASHVQAGSSHSHSHEQTSQQSPWFSMEQMLLQQKQMMIEQNQLLMGLTLKISAMELNCSSLMQEVGEIMQDLRGIKQWISTRPSYGDPCVQAPSHQVKNLGIFSTPFAPFPSDPSQNVGPWVHENVNKADSNSRQRLSQDVNFCDCFSTSRGKVIDRVSLLPPLYGIASFNTSKPHPQSSSFRPSAPSSGGYNGPVGRATPVASASDNLICPICLTDPKDMAFGCGHQTCCECGQDLELCPICRSTIQTRIKLY